jgi:hypothetical protein
MKALLFAALFLHNCSAFAASRIGELVMTSPDSATVRYADRCSNGRNITEAIRAQFVRAMLANPESKISQLKAQILKEIRDSGDTPRGEGFALGAWSHSYHDRAGCSTSSNSYSALAASIAGGNTNHKVSRFLVTIDDDDEGGTRTLKLRSIQPVSVRDGQ